MTAEVEQLPQITSVTNEVPSSLSGFGNQEEELGYNPLAVHDTMAEYAATGSFYCHGCNQYAELIEGIASNKLSFHL